MSEQTRLTVAVVMTTLLLVAITAVGIVVNTGSPAPPKTGPPVHATTPHTITAPGWHEESD